MHHYGGPDIYFTEYFRVHQSSRPEKNILACIEENPSGRPAIAQMIGQSIPDLIRTADFLQTRNVAAIDLNVGCPAPIVCKKSSGGGLLKNLELLDQIITALRQTISIPFTIKTRLGFFETSELEPILDLLDRHDIDMLTLHGRTVKEMYRAHVHYDLIRQTSERFNAHRFPVIANGNVLSADMAQTIHDATATSGWMIGRGAIRNPWIWNQIRELYDTGAVRTHPTLRDLRDYIQRLYEITRPPEIQEKYHVAKMKKYMNFIAQGVGPGDEFLQGIRRVATESEFFSKCDHYLNSDEPFDPEVPAGALINAGRPRDDSY